MILADLISPPVHLHNLLTAWQVDDPYALVALVFQFLGVVLYGWGVVRLRRRGRKWSPWRSVSFFCGVLVLDVALVSGLASYDDQVFTVHVIQHLAIMMVAPPLLALGAPVTLAMQASARRLHTGLIRVLHSPIVIALTAPLVAGALYYGSMYVDFLTPFYRYSLEHDFVHNLTHVLMFTFGCLFWWPMIGADRLPNELSFRTKAGTMIIGTVLEVILGLVLIQQSTSIAPEHTLIDTHTGGAYFLVGSLIVSVATSAVMLVQWSQKRNRSAARARSNLAPMPTQQVASD